MKRLSRDKGSVPCSGRRQGVSWFKNGTLHVSWAWVTSRPQMVGDAHKQCPGPRALEDQWSSLEISLGLADRRRDLKACQWPAQCRTIWDTEELATTEGTGRQYGATVGNTQRPLLAASWALQASCSHSTQGSSPTQTSPASLTGASQLDFIWFS